MTQAKKSTCAVMETVAYLRGLGFMPLPIDPETKKTYCKDYTAPNFVSPWDDWRKSDVGVGVILGGKYKLVDIDLDDPRIAKLAVAHLPHTPWIFGRKTKKSSHHVFVIEDKGNPEQQQRADDPAGKGYLDTEKLYHLGKNTQQKTPLKPILEFRGTGQQTVMPGTVHESTGELIQWEGKGLEQFGYLDTSPEDTPQPDPPTESTPAEQQDLPDDNKLQSPDSDNKLQIPDNPVHNNTSIPDDRKIKLDLKRPSKGPANVKSQTLRRASRMIAFTVIVSDNIWHEGFRHDVTLCLAGMMHASKWQLPEAEKFFNGLVDFSGYGERKNILACVRDTFKNAENKSARIQGAPSLIELTGRDDVVAYFRRLFTDAKEAVFEDYNSRFAAVLYFGRLGIMDRRNADDLTKPDFEVMPLQDFMNMYSNERIQVPGEKGLTWTPKPKYWFGHVKRKTYSATDFLPGQPGEVGETYNLWRGWGTKPNPAGSMVAWEEHVWRFICGENKEMHHWLMAWMADIVQNPMSKPGTAVVMRSKTRTGKNTFVEMIQRMIGIRYYHEMNNSAQLTGRFNSHLQHALLVFANEAEFAGRINAHPTLRTLITDEKFFMDHKHGHAKTSRNYTRLMLASNRLHVLEREADDQRYTVIEVGNPHEELGDGVRDHFSRVYADINGEGPAALLAHLQSYQYDRDLIRSCYQSEAGRKQILMSMPTVGQWWAMCISEGRIRVPEGYEEHIGYVNGQVGWPDWISKGAIEAAFRDQYKWAKDIPSAVFHAEFYSASGLNKKKSTFRPAKAGRPMSVRLPPILKCARLINQQYSGAVEIIDAEIVGETLNEDNFEELEVRDEDLSNEVEY